MKLVFACLLQLIFAFAVAAENTVLIKRRGTPSKAILDQKFVHVMAPGASANQSATQSLTAFSDRLKPSPPTKKSSTAKAKQPVVKPVNVHNDKNWDAYSQEQEVLLDESLGVSARLKRR